MHAGSSHDGWITQVRLVKLSQKTEAATRMRDYVSHEPEAAKWRANE